MTHCKGCGGETSPKNTYGHILGCGAEFEDNPHWGHAHLMPCCEEGKTRVRSSAYADEAIEKVLSRALDYLTRNQGRKTVSSLKWQDLAVALQKAF